MAGQRRGHSLRYGHRLCCREGWCVCLPPEPCLPAIEAEPFCMKKPCRRQGWTGRSVLLSHPSEEQTAQGNTSHPTALHGPLLLPLRCTPLLPPPRPCLAALQAAESPGPGARRTRPTRPALAPSFKGPGPGSSGLPSVRPHTHSQVPISTPRCPGGHCVPPAPCPTHSPGLPEGLCAALCPQGGQGRQARRCPWRRRRRRGGG